MVSKANPRASPHHAFGGAERVVEDDAHGRNRLLEPDSNAVQHELSEQSARDGHSFDHHSNQVLQENKH